MTHRPRANAGFRRRDLWPLPAGFLPLLAPEHRAIAQAPTGTSSPASPTVARADSQKAALAAAMRQAEALRDEAQRAGDQPFGAVVLRGLVVVGASPSRVVTANDPTAHAEMEALRDAARRLGTRDLSDCVLVSTSRPCRMCEAAAGWARISRMVHGPALTDAGAPT